MFADCIFPRMRVRQASAIASTTANNQICADLVSRSCLALRLLLALAIAGGLSARPAQAQGGGERVRLRKQQALSGDLLYWFSLPSGAATKPERLPEAAHDGAILLNVPPAYQAAEARLNLRNVTQGRDAHLPLTGLMAAGLQATPLQATPLPPEHILTKKDFAWASAVEVPVNYRGKGAEGLLVSLRYQGQDRGRLKLQASDNGIARFHDVPLNERLDFTLSNGKQAETYVRLLMPEATNTLSELLVPESWTDVKTVSAPLPSIPANPMTAPVVPPGVGSSLSASTLPASSSEARRDYLLLLLAGLLLALVVFLGGLLWLWMRTPHRVAVSKKRAVVTGTVPLPARNPPVVLEESHALVGSGPFPTAERNGSVIAESPPRLVGKMGPYRQAVFLLTEPHLTIGRDSVNGIALPQDINASRQHAAIECQEGQIILTDLNSSNGTFVNGVRIPNQMPKLLHPGDKVEIGGTVFRVEV